MMLKNIELQDTLQQPRVVKAVLAGLFIILIISVVQLIQMGVAPMQLSNQSNTTQSERTQAFTPSPLFGVSPTLGVLQQTRLDLTLKGTFSATHTSAGAVVIGAPNKPDKIYVVGETVPGGAIIREIAADYIVLEYEGKNEILRLPQGQRLTSP